MDRITYNAHLRAGYTYGKKATCGSKVKYNGEETARIAAGVMSAKVGRDLEHYPCYWCGIWHIGRRMTEEEFAPFKVGVQG